jgi:hypothetical protein
MVASLLKVISSGIQDERLSFKPSLYPFKKIWIKAGRFTTQWQRLDFENTPTFGNTAFLRLLRKGHLISRLVLVANMPDIYSVQRQAITNNGGAPAYPQFGWTNSLGHAMCQQITLDIAGSRVETLDSRLLEILDEFYDDIERSYGDYGQIINNWKTPTHNIYYIYELILKNYYNRGYYREAADCAAALMRSFHTHSVALEYWMYMHILEIWYDSTVRHCPEKQGICSNRIREICKTDVLLQAEYKKRADYFDAMFRISIRDL